MPFKQRASDVTWTSPSAGDTFGPGDTLIAKWTSAAATSPSFRLCLSSGDGCGSVVWPEAEQSAGQFIVSMATPEVDSDEEFYLEMKDDDGNTVNSPVFTLSVSAPVAPVIASSSSIPSSAPSFPSQSMAADPAALNPGQQPLSPSPNALPNQSSANDNLLSTAGHNTPSSALFAIPLSIVGAILIIAIFIALRHARTTRETRIKEAERLKLQRNSSFTSFLSGKTDVESVFRREEVPVPLFMGPQVERKPRIATRQVYHDNPRRTSRVSYPSSRASSTRDRLRDASSTWSAREDYDYYDQPPKYNGQEYTDSRDERPRRDDSRRTRTSSRDSGDYGYDYDRKRSGGSRSSTIREYESSRSSRSGGEHSSSRSGQEYASSRRSSRDYDDRARHSQSSRYDNDNPRPNIRLSIPSPLLPGLNSPQKLHVRRAAEYDYVFDNNASSPVPGDRRSMYGAVADAVRHGGRRYDY